MKDRVAAVAALVSEAQDCYPRDAWRAIGLLSEAIKLCQPNPIRDARQTLWRAFVQDPSFAQTYRDNIACVIMDYEKLFEEPGSNRPPLSHEQRNALAERIFTHIFREEL